LLLFIFKKYAVSHFRLKSVQFLAQHRSKLLFNNLRVETFKKFVTQATSCYVLRLGYGERAQSRFRCC